ncbi:MAG TPA: CocE/NonD family hydrolase, partial [Candidatus Hydrogenedentes bacterium]|nr:CocE/NonD family hydrolase [Candidatus Hydrogenedentota bacterium]
MRGIRELGVFLCALGALSAPAHAEFLGSFMMPADDGTLLHTRVYVPLVGGPPPPMLLGRTPYAYFAEEGDWSPYGIGFAQQATRGQWDSEGEYAPFERDGPDGRVFAVWAPQQPWCNGRVGFFAGSGKGALTALSLPATSNLACFILRPTPTDIGDEFIYQGGVYRKAVHDIWLNQEAINAPYLEARWRAHPPNDPYWEQFAVSSRAHEVTAPGLHIGGYYDIVEHGTLKFFIACQYRGGPGARGAQRLVMRATAHAKYDFLEGLTFDFHPNYLDIDPFTFERDFALHYLRDIDTGVLEGPPVVYYTVGDDQHHDGLGWEWRTALRWPPLPPRKTWFHLHPDGLLDVAPPIAESGSRNFHYDPANPVPSLGGQNIKASDRESPSAQAKIAYGPYDQNDIGPRDDVLRFYSAPLAEPLEATGNFRVRLYVGSDASDTDFTAKVVDAYPEGDGREILVLDGIQRVKYRGGRGVEPQYIAPGEVVELDIDLGDTSWIFNTGHRLGLHVSSSNYPRFDVNPNNGDDIPGLHPAQVAHNFVFTNALRPSALAVPVRMPDADSDADGRADEQEWDSPDGDMDGDGVPDEVEFYCWPGLDPLNPDTDGDGWNDGAEVAAFTLPTDPE